MFNAVVVMLSAGGEPFAVHGAMIKGVVEIAAMAALVDAPDFVRGLVQFEGEPLPVIDLKARAGRHPTALTPRSCVVVVELERESKPLRLAMLVDSELDVAGAMRRLDERNWRGGGRGGLPCDGPARRKRQCMQPRLQWPERRPARATWLPMMTPPHK